METTAKVVEFFDQLFDSVNGKPGGAAKGKLRKAIKMNSKHQAFWMAAIKKIKNLKFLDSTSKLAIQAGTPRLIRVPSLEGWITTLESFIRLSKLLFQNYNLEYYYPRFINQDPLENFFGRIRALNYRNNNPDTNMFLHSFKSLMMSNLLSPHSKFANCEADDGDSLLDVSFLFDDKQNENENTLNPSTSRDCPISQSGSSMISKDEVVLEKIKVQCSAYTAGYLCRKLSKKNPCKSCIKTYTSTSTENIHTFIKYREYKMLKNDNLVYPNETFLMMYRDASSFIHNYLNQNGHEKNIGSRLSKELYNFLRLLWLGCCPSHSKLLKSVLLKILIRLHVHNWCNVINKILKEGLSEKNVSKMSEIQKIAYMKYKTLRLRNKILNK